MADFERVLVTGGCGFIGANLVRRVRASVPWSLRVVDDMRIGRAGTVEELAEVVEGDVRDPSVLEEALEGIDAVVHLASQTGVLPSVEDPTRDFEGNTAATFLALEGCRRRGIEHFVFASSGAALGDVDPPLHEDLVPRPLSPYGAGKLAGEAYCRGYAGSFGMHTVSLRFANVYGPFSAHKNNAVPNFIVASLKNEAIELYGDGSQTRDFVYVEDLCAGIVAALESEGNSGEVYQLGTGIETSINELVGLVQEATGSSTEVRHRPARRGEVRRSRVDISKAQRELGFDPRIELAEGLARTVAWYRDRPR